MSLHHSASQVASKGRNGDTMLVHMTPEEVGGLQALALSTYGKPLTINPHTGVVEASLLKRLLPTIAGAIVGNIVPGAGAWGSAIAGGIAAGAANGWKLKNVGAGMIGGASGRELAKRLSAIGATPTTTSSAASTTPTTTTVSNVPSEVSSQFGLAETEPTVTTRTSPAAATQAANAAVVKATSTPVKPTFKDMGEGIRRLFTDEKLRQQFARDNFWPIAGAVGSYAALPDVVKASSQNRPRFWVQDFHRGTKVNPLWQKEQGQPYWEDQYWDEGRYTTDDPFATGYASGGSTTTEQPLKEGDVPAVAQTAAAPAAAPAPTQRYYSQDYKSPYHADIMSYIDAVNARRKYTPKAGAATGTTTGTTTGTDSGSGLGDSTGSPRNDTGTGNGSGTGGTPVSEPVVPNDVVEVTPPPPRGYISPYGDNGGLRNLINSRFPTYNIPNLPETDQTTEQAVYDPETGERTDTPQPAPERSGILDTGRNLFNLPGDIKQMISDRAIDAAFDLFQGDKNTAQETYDPETGERVDTPEERGPWENRAMQGGRILGDPLDALLHLPTTIKNIWQGNPVEPIKNPLLDTAIDVSSNITKTPEEIAREESARRRAQTRANREANGGTGAGSGGGSGAGTGVARAGNGSGRGGISLPRFNVIPEFVPDSTPGKARGGRIGYASGGVASLGRYSDGGRLLRGPGDGVSDDIPAMIHRDDGSRQEARLADGEFVFPARIVSEIGNGSTEAGAQKLYAIMDKIQRDRKRSMRDVALDSNAERHFASLMA